MNADRLQRIGEKLMSEAQGKAKQRAEAIFGPQPSGTEDMSRKAFLEYTARNWADPQFRAGLLARVGATQFRETVIALHGGDEAVWPLPWKETMNGG